jgi:hypothetical protein
MLRDFCAGMIKFEALNCDPLRSLKTFNTQSNCSYHKIINAGKRADQ